MAGCARTPSCGRGCLHATQGMRHNPLDATRVAVTGILFLCMVKVAYTTGYGARAGNIPPGVHPCYITRCMDARKPPPLRSGLHQLAGIALARCSMDVRKSPPLRFGLYRLARTILRLTRSSAPAYNPATDSSVRAYSQLACVRAASHVAVVFAVHPRGLVYINTRDSHPSARAIS